MKLSFFNKKNLLLYDFNIEKNKDLELILRGEMTVATICQDIISITESQLCAVVLISTDKPFNIIYSTTPSISFCQDMPLLSIHDEIVISNNIDADPRNTISVKDESSEIQYCPIKKLLSIPISNQNTIYGKILIANRKKGYSKNTIYSIEKQISYIISLIVSQDDNTIFTDKNPQVSFLSSLAHEIKTPVHCISSMINLLSLEGNLNEKQRKFVSCALSSCEDLIETVADSIDFQKIKNNSLSIINDTFNLHDMMNQIIELVSFKANEKNIKLNLIIDEKVPNMVHGDKSRIQQVLLNIIGNAIKFTTIGTVTIKVGQIPSRIIFSICDTGCGIKKENISRIFNEYFQEEKYSKNGLGLGLSLSKKLIQMMGGGITVESTFGIGSTFTIDLPLYEERFFLDFSSDDDKDQNVLIIDPIENNRIVLRKYLKQWKLNVQVVSSYKEGKRVIDDEAFDIIIINPVCNLNEAYIICHLVEDKSPETRLLCIGDQTGNVFDGNIKDISNKFDVYNTILSVKKKKKHSIQQINIESFRVCIVEDDLVSAISLKEVLMRKNISGNNITTIDNGEYAVRNITHNRYDIVFIDCKLKGEMDGIKVTQIIKSSISHIRVIGMTASITEDEKTTWLNSGLDGMVIKPFSSEAIYNILGIDSSDVKRRL